LRFPTFARFARSVSRLKTPHCGVFLTALPLTGEQREAASRLRCLMGNIEYRFFKTYGMEIDDVRTVYALCAWNILPERGEPAVCLMKDWTLLPSA
jgi:hypothetical protein